MSEVKMPVGYKQTEFGVYPIDWKQYKLEEVADVIDPHPSHRAPPEVKNGIPFLGIGDLDEHGRIIKDSYRTVGHHIFDEHSNRYNLSDGLIGLGRVASIGKVVKFDKLSSKFTVSPTLGLIRPKSVDFDYLAHFLKSDFVLNQFRQIMSGSTRSSVGMQVLRKLIVLMPSPEEQTAIANALTDTDNLIQSLEKLIAKKEAIKTGTMQQLLTGKTRLPEFATRENGSTKGFKQTELGKIPEDWEVVKIGNIAKTFSGGTPSTSNKAYYGGEIDWITSSDLNKGQILEVNGKISELGFMNSSAQRVEKNTLLLALYGATAGVSAITRIEATINQAVLAIVPYKDNSEFLFYWFTQEKDNIIEKYTQGGQPNLSGNIVRAITLSLPPIKEQTAIATILSNMDAEIKALQDRLEKTKSIKQGMMQQLLTGKVRLV